MTRGALAVVACLIWTLVACGDSDGKGSSDGASEGEKVSVLAEAHEACLPGIETFLIEGKMEDEATAEEFLTLEDDGASLSIQNPPQGGGNSAPATILAIQCVLDETDAPASVTSELEQTTALMGRQETDWEGVEMSWSYHPDDGLSAVLTTSD